MSQWRDEDMSAADLSWIDLCLRVYGQPGEDVVMKD